MELYDLLKSRPDGMPVMTDRYEYKLKINHKRQIVVKARPRDQYYYSNQLDKFDPPKSKKDANALLTRIKSWKMCENVHIRNENMWWCSQDYNSCPTCSFYRIVGECEKDHNIIDECTLCGVQIAQTYTGHNKMSILNECKHNICKHCLDTMVSISGINAPELEGYVLNCPFCRTENIIKYN